VDEPVRLDRLGVALGLDQAVPGQPVQDLVEVADVQAAPLIAHRLLEAALQLVTVRGLMSQQSQHGVMKRHVSDSPARAA
jgi:hypothetical protein